MIDEEIKKIHQLPVLVLYLEINMFILIHTTFTYKKAKPNKSLFIIIYFTFSETNTGIVSSINTYTNAFANMYLSLFLIFFTIILLIILLLSIPNSIL